MTVFGDRASKEAIKVKQGSKGEAPKLQKAKSKRIVQTFSEGNKAISNTTTYTLTF